MQPIARALLSLLAAALLATAAAGCGTASSHARAPSRRVRGGSGPHPAGGPCRSTPTTRSEARAVALARRRSVYVARGLPRRRELALTFDDGPSAFTPKILRILRHKHVPATFFVVGYAVRAYRAALHEEERARMAIGDHTMTHPLLAALRPAAQQRQIDGLARAIASCPLLRPRLFRPPYGSFDAATLRILRRDGMLMVLWSVDPADYFRPGATAIVRRVLARARPGSIVLLHDGGGDRSQTVAALPRIINALRRRGYRLVSVPRLVRDDPPARHARVPASLAAALNGTAAAPAGRRRPACRPSHPRLRSRRSRTRRRRYRCPSRPTSF